MEATPTSRDIDALCVTVVEAVADRAHVDPVSMTPLATVLDPDALDAVVEGSPTVRVAFDYAGHSVVVCGDGTVSVDGDEYDASSTCGDR